MASESDQIQESAFLAEYIRHINQLSTGSILLITIFLEKLFLQPKWKVLVGVSLVAFLVSVIGGVFVYSVTAFYVDKEFDGGRRVAMLAVGCTVALWAGFLVGVISIAIFALRNLF
jgi:hypothetical protein